VTSSAAALYVFVAVVAVAWPLYDHFVDWPRFRRWIDGGIAHARLRQYGVAVTTQWTLVALCAALWVWGSRPWGPLGLSVPRGWRFWIAVALIVPLSALYVWQASVVARSGRAREKIRRGLSILESIVPHSGAELAGFVVVALTAGACEELLFRGVLVSVFAPVLTWWGAAAAALVPFGFLHSYQGSDGMIRSATLGGFLTLVWAATGSLWSAIVLHAVIDLGGGLVAWLALRKDVPSRPVEVA
jgi:membrane protease YdiL (CAAX protease family)